MRENMIFAFEAHRPVLIEYFDGDEQKADHMIQVSTVLELGEIGMLTQVLAASGERVEKSSVPSVAPMAVHERGSEGMRVDSQTGVGERDRPELQSARRVLEDRRYLVRLFVDGRLAERDKTVAVAWERGPSDDGSELPLLASNPACTLGSNQNSPKSTLVSESGIGDTVIGKRAASGNLLS